MPDTVTEPAPDRADAIQAARESFSGRTLTEPQFREAWAIAGILHGEIKKSGSFHEKLIDYAHAYARNERFDAMRSETVIRDIYTGRFGQSLNKTREALLGRQENLPTGLEPKIEAAAEQVCTLIKDGPTQPFYKAYDEASRGLAGELGVTQQDAKRRMDEAYEARHGTSLYEDGKALEEAYHKPVREAEIAARKAEQIETRHRMHSRA